MFGQTMRVYDIADIHVQVQRVINKFEHLQVSHKKNRHGIVKFYCTYIFSCAVFNQDGID